MTNLKNMKKAALAILATMMMVGAGGTAWACGPYGAMTPEQQEQSLVYSLEVRLQYQQSALEAALKDNNYTLAQSIYERITQLEADLQVSQERLAQMQNADQEVASVK